MSCCVAADALVFEGADTLLFQVLHAPSNQIPWGGVFAVRPQTLGSQVVRGVRPCVRARSPVRMPLDNWRRGPAWCVERGSFAAFERDLRGCMPVGRIPHTLHGTPLVQKLPSPGVRQDTHRCNTEVQVRVEEPTQLRMSFTSIRIPSAHRRHRRLLRKMHSPDRRRRHRTRAARAQLLNEGSEVQLLVVVVVGIRER